MEKTNISTEKATAIGPSPICILDDQGGIKITEMLHVIFNFLKFRTANSKESKYV